MDPIRKAFSVVSKAIDLDAGIFEAMISTEAVDRQGDIVRATGAQLGNYLKNPVVLWAHDYAQPPVAKALSIEIMPGTGLKATFQFPEWSMNPQADVVRRMWAAGFLNATSIGFMPLKSKPVDGTKDEDTWWVPQEYTSWELLEFSIVPVPANQEALRLAMKSLTPALPKGRKGQKAIPITGIWLRTSGDFCIEVLAEVNGKWKITHHVPYTNGNLISDIIEPLGITMAPDDEKSIDYLAKRGRVLSAANEKKLRSASEALNDVLSQLGESEPEEESLPAQADTELPASESNTDPTSNDMDEELVKALENLINTLNGE